jgi:hypothetical protein
MVAWYQSNMVVWYQGNTVAWYSGRKKFIQFLPKVRDFKIIQACSETIFKGDVFGILTLPF